jgi:hypothetical protein
VGDSVESKLEVAEELESGGQEMAGKDEGSSTVEVWPGSHEHQGKARDAHCAYHLDAHGCVSVQLQEDTVVMRQGTDERVHGQAELLPASCCVYKEKRASSRIAQLPYLLPPSPLSSCVSSRARAAEIEQRHGEGSKEKRHDVEVPLCGPCQRHHVVHRR